MDIANVSPTSGSGKIPAEKNTSSQNESAYKGKVNCRTPVDSSSYSRTVELRRRVERKQLTAVGRRPTTTGGGSSPEN